MRRNMEMFERAFAMFTPFARARASRDRSRRKRNRAQADGEEIYDLKRQMEEMQKRLDRLSERKE